MLRLTAPTNDDMSQVEILDGTANTLLGFTQAQSATQQNVANIDALPFRNGADVPAQVSQPTPSTPKVPQTSASIEARKVSAPESVGQVIFTRIQQLLLSGTAGAATPGKEAAR